MKSLLTRCGSSVRMSTALKFAMIAALTLVGAVPAFADLPEAVYTETGLDWTAICTSMAVVLVAGIVIIQTISLGINAIVSLFNFFRTRVRPKA